MRILIDLFKIYLLSKGELYQVQKLEKEYEQAGVTLTIACIRTKFEVYFTDFKNFCVEHDFDLLPYMQEYEQWLIRNNGE